MSFIFVTHTIPLNVHILNKLQKVELALITDRHQAAVDQDIGAIDVLCICRG